MKKKAKKTDAPMIPVLTDEQNRKICSLICEATDLVDTIKQSAHLVVAHVPVESGELAPAALAAIASTAGDRLDELFHLLDDLGVVEDGRSEALKGRPPKSMGTGAEA